MNVLFKTKPSVYIFALISFLLTPWTASAFTGLTVTVEIVNATQEGTYVSPELEDLVREVSPVLNFKGFKLIKKSEFPLNIQDSNELMLPQDRIMVITLEEFEKDQARLKLKILKEKNEVFATTLLLIDNGNAILGGPTMTDGVMLLRVGGKFIP